MDFVKACYLKVHTFCKNNDHYIEYLNKLSKVRQFTCYDVCYFRDEITVNETVFYSIINKPSKIT